MGGQMEKVDSLNVNVGGRPAKSDEERMRDGILMFRFPVEIADRVDDLAAQKLLDRSACSRMLIGGELALIDSGEAPVVEKDEVSGVMSGSGRRTVATCFPPPVATRIRCEARSLGKNYSAYGAALVARGLDRLDGKEVCNG